MQNPLQDLPQLIAQRIQAFVESQNPTYCQNYCLYCDPEVKNRVTFYTENPEMSYLNGMTLEEMNSYEITYVLSELPNGPVKKWKEKTPEEDLASINKAKTTNQEDELKILGTHKSTQVRLQVARNPDTPNETVQALLRDTNPLVADQAGLRITHAGLFSEQPSKNSEKWEAIFHLQNGKLAYVHHSKPREVTYLSNAKPSTKQEIIINHQATLAKKWQRFIFENGVK